MHMQNDSCKLSDIPSGDYKLITNYSLKTMVSRERNGRLILLLGDFFSLTGRGKIRELVFAEIGVFTLQIGACRI